MDFFFLQSSVAIHVQKVFLLDAIPLLEPPKGAEPAPGWRHKELICTASNKQGNSPRFCCISDSWSCQTLPAGNSCRHLLNIPLLLSLEHTSFFFFCLFKWAADTSRVTELAGCEWFWTSCDHIGRGKSRTNTAQHQQQINVRKKHFLTYSESKGEFEHL